MRCALREVRSQVLIDLFPAKALGLRTAHIRRGPYGHWWAEHPDVTETADWHITALTELPSLVDKPAGDRAPAPARSRALRSV